MLPDAGVQQIFRSSHINHVIPERPQRLILLHIVFRNFLPGQNLLLPFQSVIAQKSFQTAFRNNFHL